MSASAAPVQKPLESGGVHPVDEVLAAPRLITLGIQHVLVMYAGAVAVPLIIGAAVKAKPEQVAFLIESDLLACGIASLLQSVGLWRFGIRLPVIMGVTFAAVAPMVAIGSDPSLGLLGIYGATIVAGIFTIIMAPFVGRVLPLFPPVVTGTIITVIGLSLFEVGINWAAGGVGNPLYGRPLYLGLALFVLLVILAITRLASGFVRNIAVLLGLVIGMVVAYPLGQVDFSRVGAASWFSVATPFYYGMPIFDPVACLTMCIVMIVVMIESLGMFLALGEICDRPLGTEDLARGLRVDGLATLIGGIMNTFPHSSFSQNVGLVGVTGVRSRWVCATGGVMLILLGLIPKLAAVVASVPAFVLGGAGLVMFGMVAATGIRILAAVNLEEGPYNMMIIAVSIGFGMIPVVAHNFFGQLPHLLAPVLHSGILLAAVSSVALNAYFNGVRGRAGHGFKPVHAAHGVDEGGSGSHE